MKNKLAMGVVLSLLSLTAAAEADIGFYAGGGAGRVTLKDSVSGLKIRAHDDTAYKIFAGYRFHEYGSLEASYLTGTPSDRVSGILVESDATAWQASGLWQVPISDRFEAYVRFSIVWWEAENSATDGRAIVRYENNGNDAGFGIGAALHITPKLGLRAEYEGADLDGTDLRALSLSGLFRF